MDDEGIGRDVVVIGGSAGALDPLIELVRALPAGLPAAVLVVIDVSPSVPSALPSILSRVFALPVGVSRSGDPLLRGRIHVAHSDHHLLVDGARVLVSRGPRENRHRPAIDPLFRTAALAHGPRVVGVVLSETLDDGTSGARSILTNGGVVIVRSPEEATHPGMPSSAISFAGADDVAAGPELAKALVRRVAESTEEGLTMQDKDKQKRPRPDATGSPEDPASGFTCPECNGALWEVRDGHLMRYECRVGHAFSGESFLDAQEEAVEAVGPSRPRGRRPEQLQPRPRSSPRAAPRPPPDDAHRRRAEDHELGSRLRTAAARGSGAARA